ncbi:MAG TPA: hypothetical protein PLV68_02280, partial [Ilumatobacteraceae bacterium]|nr:hypothetical protein [Ilumatobacteraceae bacterium]
MLTALGEAWPTIALADDHTGITKLALTRAVLGLRRRYPATWAGTYTPLALSGRHAGAAIAFNRAERQDGGQSDQRDGAVVVVAATRPVAVARDGWGDTTVELPPGR